MKLSACLSGLLFTACSLVATTVSAEEINLYTTREPGLIKNILTVYTQKTGIKVNTVFLKDGLAERVMSEGEKSPADVLMTVDFSNLVDLSERGLLQTIQSPTLEAAVPASLRDEEGRWFSLSLRARTLYTVKTGGPARLDYEDLADPKWIGKICMRSGHHPYNTALIAHYIAKHGEAKAEAWLTGLKANLARKAGGGDREVARDIMGGLCDIGLGNSYYVGLMRSAPVGSEPRKWGEAIHVVLPTFRQGGTHVNISGAGIAKYAPNKAAAVKLLEFLVSPEAQAMYAQANFEYPLKRGVALDPLIANLGELRVDDIPLSQIAKYRQRASYLVDKVRFDQ